MKGNWKWLFGETGSQSEARKELKKKEELSHHAGPPVTLKRSCDVFYSQESSECDMIRCIFFSSHGSCVEDRPEGTEQEVGRRAEGFLSSPSALTQGK